MNDVWSWQRAAEALPPILEGFRITLLATVVGMVLFAISFQGPEWSLWTFAGAIASITLAFMIPTTILPALEGD